MVYKINNNMDAIREFERDICGDCRQDDESIVVASGSQTKNFGFLHTWYIDGAAASFGGTKAGVLWEIIAVDKISEIITIDPDDYEDGKDDEEYKEMEKFIKELEDSVCDGELIFNPKNELEAYQRIW